MMGAMRRAVLAVVVSLTFALAISAAASAQAPLTGLQRQEIPADGGGLLPGLAVRYYFGMFDTMWEMGRMVRSRPGRPGDPILKIDTFFDDYEIGRASCRERV